MSQKREGQMLQPPVRMVGPYTLCRCALQLLTGRKWRSFYIWVIRFTVFFSSLTRKMTAASYTGLKTWKAKSYLVAGVWEY